MGARACGGKPGGMAYRFDFMSRIPRVKKSTADSIAMQLYFFCGDVEIRV